ncbi:MAG: hypothetical protein KDJ22_15475 [Candidatus Competibacteraceae bacterium]|nr:hypothetical protein [Candidatus Competibacteraceae bacterium]MCP5124164.1 hypothetical protein [Gammaproteobacteria bacterium]HRX71396.1 hypothetical protein [Candidatus Competibacteraceae bacterium]
MVLRLLQSIFTTAPNKPGKFDEALIRSAIERVVDGTDPRLRAVRHYQRKLRDAVEQAIEFVVAFVDTFPPAVELSRRSFTTDPRVRALFASPEQLREVISFSQGMLGYLDQNPGPLPETLYAVLVAERVEKNIIGMDLQGDLMRRDVVQTVVNFHDPRVSLPTDSATESRHNAMNRVFDYLVEIALQRLLSTRSRKQQLEQQQRLLLQKKAQLYKASTLALEPLMEIRVPAAPDAGALEKQLQEIETELTHIRISSATIENHLAKVAATLREPEKHLRLERVILHLNHMNVKMSANSRHNTNMLEFDEIVLRQDARRFTMLFARFPSSELLPQPDFLEQARRMLTPRVMT